MSGTAFGTIVLHMSPESAVGGPLAAVENGDRVRLSVADKRIDLLVDDAEIARRLEQHKRPELQNRGYRGLYSRTVLQADEGCDFDFLTQEGWSKENAE